MSHESSGGEAVEDGAEPHGYRMSLQINDDMPLQRRTWIVERIGWIVMGILVLAALAGVFATGPASWAEAHDPSGQVRVEYERFQRHMAPFSLQVHIAPESVSGDTIAVRLNADLVNAIQVQKVVPEPQNAKATADGIAYTFAVLEPGKPAALHFSFLVSRTFGTVDARIGLSGRPPARFTIFVYP